MTTSFDTFSPKETLEANEWFDELDHQWNTQHPNWIEDLLLRLDPQSLQTAHQILASNPPSQIPLPELPAHRPVLKETTT